MCELFVARVRDGFRLGELWELVERLERYGIAGFGWGVAWTAGSELGCHAATGAFRDDPARDRLAELEASCALVHLRRPSRLSTVGPADTQPFVDPAGRFAFAHNGDFARYREPRARFVVAGRIHGRADSEVGMRLLEDRWDGPTPDARPGAAGEDGGGRDVGAMLSGLHDELGGEANMAVLQPDASAHVHAGNAENPVFAFRLGHFDIVSTGIYSLDRSFFRLVAPAARDRRAIRHGGHVRVG